MHESHKFWSILRVYRASFDMIDFSRNRSDIFGILCGRPKH